jgi:predicted metalloprotease with PDZ domain
MNRVHVTNSAMPMGIVLTALLSVGALAAEPGRSALNEAASPAALQQRLESAQRRLDRAAQEVADLSVSLSAGARADTSTTRSSRRSQRPALGVNIGSDADGKRNDGVVVLSVSRGSPAYEAGLKSGDLLLAVNNKPLRRDEDGTPREQLLAVMRSVNPGEKVPVKYRREGFTKTVDLIMRPISVQPSSDDAPPPVARAERVEKPKVAILRAEGVLDSAELAPLTPRLGQYFGTDQGLLVVRAPADEGLGIQEGDVILEIDGRTPTSTSQATRILNSYEPGEELSISVLRRKRRFDIDVVIPEDAPRARGDRSNAPALSRSSRANALPAPAPARRSVRPSAQPEPAESEQLQVRPLPDDEIEVEQNN